MFRIVLCDNDPEDLRSYEEKIRGAVADLIPDFEIITYRTPESLLFAIDDIRDLADVMVLDIRMPRTDGIELAKKLRKAGYKNDIIFLTQSEEDMLRAFDVGALNYIVKGKTSRERAAFVIRQAIRSSLEKRSRNLLLEIGGEIRSIPVEDILYIEVRDHLILV
ncbi:MAG: response regulator, partial [Firmicutes bacterium]|nr:response regulator [Bacillota bacterium]